jgi:hypothetical protein
MIKEQNVVKGMQLCMNLFVCAFTCCTTGSIDLQAN